MSILFQETRPPMPRIQQTTIAWYLPCFVKSEYKQESGGKHWKILFRIWDLGSGNLPEASQERGSRIYPPFSNSSGAQKNIILFQDSRTGSNPRCCVFFMVLKPQILTWNLVHVRDCRVNDLLHVYSKQDSWNMEISV